MKTSLLLLIIVYSFHSMASGFRVEAETFSSVFQRALFSFKLRTEKLAKQNLFRNYLTHMTFEFPEGTIPADCSGSTQALNLKTETAADSIEQLFTFKDCNGKKETLTLTRRGPGLKPLTLAEFMNGVWDLPVNNGDWTLETSWNPIKVRSQKTTEGHEVFVFLNYMDPLSLLHSLEFSLKEIHKTEGPSELLRREYGVKEGSSGGFSTYAIQQERDGSLFSEEICFLNQQEINPLEFSTGYQSLISGALVPLLGMTLGNLPVK